MSAMETWDSSELPTKFNKYKRLKEREEKEAANNKNHQFSSVDQPTVTRESDVNATCSTTLTATSISDTLMSWKSADSPREQANELCPDGLALKKRLVSTQQQADETSFVSNGYDLPSFSDRPSSSSLQGISDWRPHNSASYDVLLQLNRASSSHSAVFVGGGSPRLNRLKEDRSLGGVCRCGSCSQCQRPSSANSVTQYARSRDLSGNDAPLNLTVSSNRASHSSLASQWRQGSNGAELGYTRHTVQNSDAGSSRVVDEHFERSLGTGYLRLVNNPISSSETPRIRPVQTNASDCVDDHFSKSLGDLWPRVKDNGNSTTGRVSTLKDDPATSSVDDHFTKALGAETWHRIKTTNEKSVYHSVMPHYPT